MSVAPATMWVAAVWRRPCDVSRGTPALSIDQRQRAVVRPRQHEPALAGGDDQVVVFPVAAGEQAFGGLLGRGACKARSVSSSIGILRRDRSFLASLHAAPCVDGDDALVDPQRLGVEVEVVPVEGEQLAAAQPVEHAEPERRRPIGGRRRLEEASHLGRVPRRRSPSPWPAWRRCGEGRPERAGLRGMIPSSTASASAARRTVRQICTLRRDSSPAGGQRVDPLGDVLTVEPGQRDRIQARPRCAGSPTRSSPATSA